MSEEGIALSEMIEQLREELTLSMAKGADEKIRFEPLEVTLEAQVTVTREVSGGGGIKFWVVNADAKAGASSSHVQKIVLKLRPVGAHGESKLLGRGEN